MCNIDEQLIIEAFGRVTTRVSPSPPSLQSIVGDSRSTPFHIPHIIIILHLFIALSNAFTLGRQMSSTNYSIFFFLYVYRFVLFAAGFFHHPCCFNNVYRIIRVYSCIGIYIILSYIIIYLTLL